MPMKNPQDFDIKLQELESFTSYLNGMIADGSFYRLPFRERYRYIRKVKQLYTQLRGPVSPVSLRRLLPIAVLAALVVPIPIGGDAKATPASFLMSCTMDSSLPASSGNLRIQLAGPVDIPDMERATLTVSGPNMATIQREFSGTVDVISILVPEGDNRTFELEAIPDPAAQSFVMRYRGETTVNLQRGQTTEISLEMNPVPIEPSFKAPVEDPFGLPATVGTDYTAPTLGDLDGDGDLDLLVGDYAGTTGIYRYFENVGSVSSPSFGAESQNPFNLSATSDAAAPRVVDVDGDGDLDVFASSNRGYFGYDSYLYSLENVGGQSSPDFGSPGLQLTVYGVTFSTFGDLDSDGDYDMLIGNSYYSPGQGRAFRYYENSGTPSSPSFGTASIDPFGLAGVPFYVTPALVDLDGDGDLDILAGSDAGTFYYFENTGSAAAPSFAGPTTDPFGLTTVASGQSSVAVGDMDGDGDTDVVAGEYNAAGASLWYFENQAID